MHFRGRPDIGQEWIGIQEQHQRSALSQMICDRPLSDETLGLLHNIGGKVGTIERRGPWHSAHPFALMRLVSIQSSRSIPGTGGTLQSIMKWEHLGVIERDEQVKGD